MTEIRRQKYRKQDFSNVIGRLCLDNVGSSIGIIPQPVEQYSIQSSTYPSGEHVDTVFTRARLITAETVRNDVYSFNKWYTPTEHSSKSIPEDDHVSALDNLYVNLDRTYTNELVERLEFLAEPSDDVNEPTLSYGSLKQFIGFIKAHRFQEPDLVLSFDGNVRAEWRQDKAHHFVAEFLPDGFVKFVVFVQSTRDAKKIERIAGTTSLEKLKGFMETSGAKWCIE